MSRLNFTKSTGCIKNINKHLKAIWIFDPYQLHCIASSEKEVIDVNMTAYFCEMQSLHLLQSLPYPSIPN